MMGHFRVWRKSFQLTLKLWPYIIQILSHICECVESKTKTQRQNYEKKKNTHQHRQNDVSVFHTFSNAASFLRDIGGHSTCRRRLCCCCRCGFYFAVTFGYIFGHTFVLFPLHRHKHIAFGSIK